MTDSQIIEYARSILNEPSPKFWTAENMTLWLSTALIVVYSSFWELLIEPKQTYENKSLVANDPDITLPTNCYKVVKVEVASTGQELHKIDTSRLHEYEKLTTNEPAGWLFKGGKIHLRPTPGASYSNYLRIWYMPKVTQVSDLPEELHPLLAVELLIAGKEKDEDVSNDLIIKHRRFTESARHALSVSQIQDMGSLEDYEEQENPY